MLNRRWLVAAAVVAILLAGISRAPMWLLADALADRQPLFGYTLTHGTVWDGGVVDAQFGDWPLGSLSMDLQPLHVLRGRLRYAVTSDSPAVTIKDMDVTGNGVVLRDAIFRGPVSFTMNGGGRLTAHTEISTTEVKVARNACLDATGTFVVSGLRFAGVPSAAIALPAVTGSLSCVDGNFQLSGQGAGDIGEMVVNVTTAVGGGFDVSISLRDAAPGIAPFLPLLGFANAGGQWQLASSGRFGTSESL